MSAAVRNSAVAQGVTTSASQYVYTVPANNNLILKFGGVFNNSAAATNVTIQFASTKGSFLTLQTQSVAPGTSEVWAGWTVLNAGDQIIVVGGIAGLHYWFAGALLPYG